MQKMSLLKALQTAGITKREGQTLQEFSAEIKKIGDTDRAWFAERFAVEFDIEIEQVAKAAA